MPHSVAEDEQDPDLADKIVKKEREGIFNWIVQGYKDFIENGKHFTHPIDWKESRDLWLNYGSALQRFIQRCIEPDPENKVSTQEVYDKVVEFADAHDLDAPSSQRKCTDEIKKLPFVSYSKSYVIDGKKNQRGFKGMKLVSGEDKEEKDDSEGEDVVFSKENRDSVLNLVKELRKAPTAGVDRDELIDEMKMSLGLDESSSKVLLDKMKENGEVFYDDYDEKYRIF